jgi:hypothetical protein
MAKNKSGRAVGIVGAAGKRDQNTIAHRWFLLVSGFGLQKPPASNVHIKTQ